MSMVVQPGQVSLRQLEEIFRDQTPVRLDRNVKPDVERAAAIIAKAAKGDAAVYGVNTGFGKLAKTRIAVDDTATLQRNLILSHSSGVGEPLAHNIVRLMMVLKLLSLGARRLRRALGT